SPATPRPAPAPVSSHATPRPACGQTDHRRNLRPSMGSWLPPDATCGLLSAPRGAVTGFGPPLYCGDDAGRDELQALKVAADLLVCPQPVHHTGSVRDSYCLLATVAGLYPVIDHHEAAWGHSVHQALHNRPTAALPGTR